MNVLKRNNIVYYRMNEIVDMFIQKNKITKEKFVENYSIPASKYIILCSKEGAYVDVETEKNLKSRFCLFVKKNFFDELVKKKNLQPAKNNSKYKILGCPEESLVYRNGEDLEKISKKNKQELIIIPALIKDKSEEEDESDNIEEGDEPDNMNEDESDNIEEEDEFNNTDEEDEQDNTNEEDEQDNMDGYSEYKKNIWNTEEDKKIKLLNSRPREIPNRVLLSDEECFRNKDGEIIQLDVFGELEYNKIYFELNSVADGFGLSNLRNSVYDPRSSYELGLDYASFYKKFSSGNPKRNGVKKRSARYLTYTGLLKAFFTTRNKNTEHFVNWSMRTLFAAHLGSDTDRARVASEILKVKPEFLKQFLAMSLTPISCIYIFYLGTAKELRNKKININETISDKQHLFKYGRTSSIKRREKEHTKIFRKYGIDPILSAYAYVDNSLSSAAEAALKKGLIDAEIYTECKISSELFHSKDIKMKMVANMLTAIAEKYSGIMKNHIAEIKEKDNLISILEIKYAASIKENESLIKSHEKQIETKDQVIKSQQETMQELRKRIRQLESNN